MTQEEFAEKCGATVRSVQNWEQGGTITTQAMKLFRYIEAEIDAGRSDSISAENSTVVSGSNNRVGSTEQTTYGDNSPAIKGDNNHFGGCASIDKAFATIDKMLNEISAQRKLVEQSLAQNATLISILQAQLVKA
ncbi:MAG: hypothetical protein NC418_04615 [Muribaculaceae bacterium]|nr:hypothetical protein [Muribaculaceae bacterium]